MSKLFFAKTSVIDHAIMGPFGIQGGSYNLNFTAELPKEKFDEEQVVVDFSKGKKEVKELIDRHVSNPNQNGFDHKLWVPTRDVKVVHNDDGRITVEDDFSIVTGPRDMFRFLDCDHYGIQDEEKIEMFMTDYVNTHMDSGEVKYEVMLDDDAYPMYPLHGENSAISYFKYYHGLRNSSSFGCVNITHGHTSFVSVAGGGDRSQQIIIADAIAGLLDDNYIYHKEVHKDENTFAYATSRRGPMRYFMKRQPDGMIELDVEPTVENIVEYVSTHPTIVKLAKGLKYPCEVYISEGLQKGAAFTV
jgi:6-pyruvoyl-tetrahydropterin synthase